MLKKRIGFPRKAASKDPRKSFPMRIGRVTLTLWLPHLGGAGGVHHRKREHIEEDLPRQGGRMETDGLHSARMERLGLARSIASVKHVQASGH